MTDLKHYPKAVRRHIPVAAPVQKSGAAMPVATPTAPPVDVHVRIGGRWIAGQALSERSGPAGSEVLISHHGHLVWVDQEQVRLP